VKHFVLQSAAFRELRLHFVGTRLLLQRTRAHFPLQSQTAGSAQGAGHLRGHECRK
jgi:hypothetical protein